MELLLKKQQSSGPKETNDLELYIRHMQKRTVDNCVGFIELLKVAEKSFYDQQNLDMKA
jgi:hypothetical protein